MRAVRTFESTRLIKILFFPIFNSQYFILFDHKQNGENLVVRTAGIGQYYETKIIPHGP